MGTISPAQSADGETIEAADINNPINTIANEFNGNIEAANLASNAVSTAKIADGAVTTAKLSTTAGQVAGAWTDYTPTYTNITVGNGTVTAAYIQIGKTVHWRFALTLGSTSSISGSHSISLPVTAHADYTSHTMGTALARDDSAADEFVGVVGALTTSSVQFFWPDHEGSVFDSETFPFTEAVDDVISATGTYEAA